ncbi:SubName: Full=Uncharacterized protein {ECO:0000313/EMBL:CCA66422.1} [Serendipita indica DSM 11827]|uniref:Uncharacterized protein n=1 Tax=Serendipita indica (strain DSM 11827) TaxID=1109443 RepID=G4T4Y7_SERID|nr:SubName: Full=Uncharacterized protein {ECO:0000313/EMBL:CCA66422.1} [Serendipita indica DSM 11827]CCA66422.1 hypothetical protein PIIN_00108 [Serendipita indica DSM 11827]
MFNGLIHYLLLTFLFAFVGADRIDDTSDSITYSNSPSWRTCNAGQPGVVVEWPGNNEGASDGSWHESLSYGSWFQTTFTGTSVSIVGIVRKKGGNTRLSVSIDGGTPVFADFDVSDQINQVQTAEDLQYGYTIFSQSGLSPTQHTIRATVLYQAAIFALDYIEFTPAQASSSSGSSPSTPASSSNSGSSVSTSGTSGSTSGSVSTTRSIITTTVSGSLITLEPTISAGVDGASDGPTILPSDSRIAYSSGDIWTTNTTCDMPSKSSSAQGASFTFSFIGTDIWVYTSANARGGKYSVSIDGNDRGEYDTYLASSSTSCKVETSFKVSGLGPSNHTLVVTNRGQTSGGQGTLDFLGLRLASSANVGGQSTSKPNTPSIVGGVIGGIAALILVGFAIFFCLRRQRSREREQEHQDQQEHQVAEIPSFPSASHEKRWLAMGMSSQHLLSAEGSGAGNTSSEVSSSSHRSPFVIPTPQSITSSGLSREQSFTTPQSSETAVQPGVGAGQALHSPPPSFRTRPLTPPPAQFRPVLGGTEEEGWAADNFYASSLPPQNVDVQTSTLPPYAEDVLSRPDARNLSENDVDAIARRLAEVMRAQREARGGPGLLREGMIPPRELIDELVEQHLEAREHGQ